MMDMSRASDETKCKAKIDKKARDLKTAMVKSVVLMTRLFVFLLVLGGGCISNGMAEGIERDRKLVLVKKGERSCVEIGC